ncbi:MULTISPECIES: hypothetical protein [unclassified Paenibacillus]|uniref:hypothetical protein n=1 Tax=unclassified Paenibacillus TaxID=185978 RepID=UPI0024063909|nr:MULTISPECIES: hypothetical protein [unclassified Paenibacillus]MDF9845543.1 hypothetical protein [Paenibacillus sp. PastF-2]MDF9852119.1 hypothetical protein [Paenibacillus sp. PastM-2]MDF9858698.1 hypothetical protein [Paenibacillus sp. PastF-1]MDH6483954.1 hypothetical protein [Paenibacillus sp. PastH-2]MDH6511333.1 hypothetical protein [Paenibacillus sp. PastM-3]
MNIKEMTQEELESKLEELILIREGFSTESNSRHMSEIEDEISQIEVALTQFEEEEF